MLDTNWKFDFKKLTESISQKKSILSKNISILGPKYCGWTPDKFLCDWTENSPVLTFHDVSKSVLIGLTSETNNCEKANRTRSYFNFHPINSAETMKWIANTIKGDAKKN